MTRTIWIGMMAWAMQAQPVTPPMPPLGSLAGQVRTPDGQGVRQALVTLRLLPDTGAPLRNYVTQQNADGQGRFSFDKLPVGRYAVCAQQPAEDVVNACVWTRTPQEVVVSAGAAVTGYVVAMAKGYRLRVAVDDVAGAVAANERLRGGVDVVVVGGPHGGVPARLDKKNGARREFVVVVPFGTPVDAWVRGPYQFEDDKGKKAEAPGQQIKLRLKEGDVAKTEVVKVTGVK